MFLPTTLALVDPSSPDGENSLDLLHDDDTHVLVVVVPSGCVTGSFAGLAVDEHISVASAAWRYLDHVADRIERPGRIVGTIVASGPDTADELATVARDHHVRRILVPGSTARRERDVMRRLADLVPAAIEAPVAIAV